MTRRPMRVVLPAFAAAFLGIIGVQVLARLVLDGSELHRYYYAGAVIVFTAAIMLVHRWIADRFNH